jgi:alkylation response protein AidB-like acyl-CoA dehydrogenase
MDFAPSVEQRMLVDAARRLADERLLPLLAAHPPDRALPRQAVLEVLGLGASLGLTSARIPESSGGAGLRMLDYGLMMEQLPPTIGLILMPHEATTARLHFGSSAEQRERFVPDLMAGRKIACTGTTEPDGGSDPRSVRASLSDAGDHMRLNGRKQWVSNAAVCDVMNVTCRMAAGDGSFRAMRVLADRDASPFEVRETPMHGVCQAPLGEALFEDTRIPLENVCPDNGSNAKLLTMMWLSNRPLVGLMAVNLAQRALDMARGYAGVRKQFGKPIGSFQLIQQDLADIETAVVTSRLLCLHALSAIDRGERANGSSAMAKRYAVDACERALALAMRVHGAMGLSRELGLEQMARDVRSLTIPDGTPGILALIQGRELTGHDAFRG